MAKTMHSLKMVFKDLIHSCNNLSSFQKMHAQLITTGVVHNDLVVNKVIEFFGKFVGFVDYVYDFLRQIDWRRSSLPFNTLISTYANSETPRAAFLVYRRIVGNGFMPDMYTFPPALKSCGKILGIGEGRQVHGIIFKMGFITDIYVQNSLVHFYSVCGQCGDACKLFDEMLNRDVVSWNGLITGYVRLQLFDEAIALFLRIDVNPNAATFVSVLVACGRQGYLSTGKGIHGFVLKRAFERSLEVSNALMDMYVKCECLCEAKWIFDYLRERDIVSWTSMISGLVQCKRPKEALDLFCDMQASRVEPDRVILTSVLSACASLGALDYGRWIHEYIDRRGTKWDIQIGTAMIDMYAKCGSIEMALKTFNGMSSRNVFTWNALLGGLAMHGHGHKALRQFEEMVRVGMRPNEVTFLAILTACCHSGLVDEGRRYFYQMTSQHYNLCLKLEHYGCMVDLLCRAGLLDEALELIKSMPMPADVLIWGALLSGCKANGNVELSRGILDQLLKLESQDSGVYVLLSNIYASNQRWADVTTVRRLMKKKGIQRAPGSSSLEVDGKTYEFLVGDTSHPQNEDIHILLNILSNQVHPEDIFQSYPDEIS